MSFPANPLDDFQHFVSPDSTTSTGKLVQSEFYTPDTAAVMRIGDYVDNQKLLDVEKHQELFQVQSESNWIELDFPGMLTRLHRHYVLRPGFEIEASSGSSLELQRIAEHSDLPTLVRETAEQVIALGDGVWRVDLVEPDEVGADADELQALVRYVEPHRFHPTLSPLDARKMVGAELAWLFPPEKVGLAKTPNPNAPQQVLLREIFTLADGEAFREYRANMWDGRELGMDVSATVLPTLDLEAGAEALGVDEIPLVHVGHNREAGKFWGRSEFPRIRPLIEALETRMSQLDEALEKHARPKLIVGPDTLDEEGRILANDFDVIEVDTSILEKAVKPEYLTWNMQVSAIVVQIEKLEEYFFLVTETSPASFGLERDGSQVESARALRFKAHRTVNKVEDARDYFTEAIRRAMRIAQKLETGEEGDHTYAPTRIKLRWPDPIIDDQSEETTNYVAMFGSGLVSRLRAVKVLHNLTDEEAAAEVAAIEGDEEASAERVAPSAGTVSVFDEANLLGAEAGSAPAPGQVGAADQPAAAAPPAGVEPATEA